MEENEKILLCDHCKRMIKDKHDLVIAYNFLALNAYHSECFAQGAKNNFFLGRSPVNGLISNIMAVVLGILGLVGCFVDFGPYYYAYAILAIVQLSIRIYAWYKYESIFEE